jgi:PAS domain S-box-containing protein
MKFLSEKYTKPFYSLAVVLLAILFGIYCYNTYEVKLANHLLQHTQEILSKSNVVLLDVVDVETGTRGFVLTGKEEFLEPYNSAIAKSEKNLSALELLTKDNFNQQSRILLLRNQIEKKLEVSKKLINLRRKSVLNEDEKSIDLDNSKTITDSIRSLIAEINAAEIVLLKQRKIDSGKITSNSDMLLGLLFIFVSIITILVFYIFNNHKKRNAELALLNDIKNLSSKYSLSLIEASLDPLITINTEGKITDTNEATARITGIEKSKLIGSDFFDYFTEHQKAREIYKEVFKTGSVSDYPLTILHKEGKLTDVLFNGSIYKDDFGNVLGVVIVARDIAEQKWALDLREANKKLAFQNDEKEKRAQELAIANEELEYQNQEKESRADELLIANKELEYQNQEKESRANELLVANEELAFQNQEKENRANELLIANKELEYQNKIKEKRAAELVIANKELAFQNKEKEKRAAELVIANKELLFQRGEKQDRADELVIANKELLFQTGEKQDRADELVIADKELAFQNDEKEKRVIENKELEDYSYSLKLASQYSLSLIEASRDPLFTISPEGKITDTNAATVRVTGVSKKDLIGSNFIDYFTNPDKAKESYEEVFSKGFVADYPLTIKDHKLTDVLFNGSVYKSEEGLVIGAVVVARDITEQKQLEKELTEAKIFAELATGIAEDAKITAEAATKHAEEAVKSKQQFLSNMSHEIRTPMNAIIGFTKVVLKTELTAKQKEYLTAIKMSGDALIVLINDILDLAKVDAGKMTFEKTPFKLKLSINAMLHLFETKIQEKNLKLFTNYDKNIPEVLVGDPVRLHQIILNLLSNAIKFTNKGKITVSINLVSENEDKVTIKFSVADTGIGIKDTKIEKVFENFQQATSGTSRLFGGTGLGLAIVKQLVEGQKGSIEVESEINKGSTFSFILDFKKTSAEAVLEPEIIELNSDVKNIKILVAEDMELNQLLMKTLLDDFGFECEIASNGKIAVDKFKEKNFDIILMDLQMPEMNGFEATEYIRKTMKSNIPIIALTADVTTVDVEKCKAVGMNDYISKPVDERLLYSKLVNIIKKPVLIIEKKIEGNIKTEKVKYVDMSYLLKLTKSNPKLMTDMITVYLKQTPPLISTMKKSFLDKDWDLLQATMHKMLPSFTIMGMSPEIAEVAQKIQEYAHKLELSKDLDVLILRLENACMEACAELEIELNNLNI